MSTLKPHNIFWVIALSIIIIFGIGLRSVHLTDVSSRSPDERIYTYFAKQIADDGFTITPKIFSQYVTEKQLWDLPPPTRIITVALFAATMKISGVRDEKAGVFLSWLFSCLSLILLAVIGIRLFNPYVALISVLFFAVSVTELGMARRAWQDTSVGFFTLLLFYVTCEITARPRRYFWYPAFFCLGSVLLLTKQTGLIAYGAFALWLFWLLAIKLRAWNMVLLFVGGGMISLVVTIAILVLAAGDVSLALAAVKRSINPGEGALAYAASAMTAEWYQFIEVLWAINPVALAMAVLGISLVVLSGWLKGGRLSLQDMNAAKIAVLITAAFFIFVAFVPGLQNLRLISPATGAYCLLSGIGIYYLGHVVRQNLPEIIAVPLVLVAVLLGTASMVGEYRVFTSAVVATGMQDLPVSWIRKSIAH